MSNHRRVVTSLAIRWNLIVSGCYNGLLYRWDATTGEPIGNAFQGNGDWVDCFAVSVDGKLILTGSRDWTVRRWDAGTVDLVGSLKVDQKGVEHMAISSDGELLVSGHNDRTVRR